MPITTSSAFRSFVLIAPLCSALTLGLSACSKDEEPPPASEAGEACDPNATNADEGAVCAEGLTCDPLASGEDYVCGTPLELRGMVIDALDDSAIEGAHVVAFDKTGAPISDVAVTDASGNYALSVPAAREPDGSIADGAIFTLAASANDYLAYPGGVRPAFPVDASQVMNDERGGDGETGGDGGGVDYVENASTTIALIPLEGEGGVTISGTVVGEEGAGTLVVAEGLGSPALSTVADKSGNYTLFNVPAGSGTLNGYRAGLSVEPATVDVADEDLEVDLSSSDAGQARVSGSVSIVNAPGDSATSVVLVPASVFNVDLERGAVPFGLRAPDGGAAPNIGGAFEINDVPAGTYKVLAAFENDALVRDPDESIAGTDIVEITVQAGVDLDIQEGFKVTEALEVVSPGADGPEAVTEAPTLTWVDDSSEDYYELVVYDALGNLVWEVPDVPRVTGAGNVEVTYAGPPLENGMYYQFRATSVKDAQGGPAKISRTEDLKGIFVYEGN